METLKIVRTLAELAELKRYLEDKDFIAFDTETTGLDKDSTIIGFSVSADVEVGYYVLLAYWDVETKTLIHTDLIKHAKDFFKFLKTKQLVMQNAVFDCNMVENSYGIELMPHVHTDTLILGHILNENRSNGLKERGVELYGEDAAKEQAEMKESVVKNGGVLNKTTYELYKADADLIAKYGAKDAILTLKLFYNDVPILYEEGLDKFFYEDESMPLLRGPTYDLNTAGLKIDSTKLQDLKHSLEAECLEAESFIKAEIAPYVKEEYPGTSKAKTFNINSSKQLSWLLFFKLGREFGALTDSGKEVCKALDMKIPYSVKAKHEFLQALRINKDRFVGGGVENPKTKKVSKPHKIGNAWNYLTCGKGTLSLYAKEYKWVTRFLEYAKNKKILNTYVEGIQERMKYGVIRPSFLQHGTTSGRYSSRNPNFQNLPRDDSRIKSCIVSRPGKILVGADYAQLEPRIFASFSKDVRLLKCFEDGDDFYSVIGAEVFDKYDCSMKKDDPNSFAKKYPHLRNISKVIALSTIYGTTAPQMAPVIDKNIHQAQEVIDSYFIKYPSVKAFMLESHAQAKKDGRVFNMFGRPRRIPEAQEIPKKYGKNASHEDLPYQARNILNLAVNYRIQSTAASIMNRAATMVKAQITELGWSDVKLVIQVHDEMVLEGPQELAANMIRVLKHCMENAVQLPGVKLIAEPKAAYNLADLK